MIQRVYAVLGVAVALLAASPAQAADPITQTIMVYTPRDVCAQFGISSDYGDGLKIVSRSPDLFQITLRKPALSQGIVELYLFKFFANNRCSEPYGHYRVKITPATKHITVKMIVPPPTPAPPPLPIDWVIQAD